MSEQTNSVSPLRYLSPTIIAAQNAFCRDRPRLLKEHKGEFVVYHGDQPVFFSKVYREALRECVRREQAQQECVLYGVEEECDLEPIDPAEFA